MSEPVETDLQERTIYEVQVWRNKTSSFIGSDDHFREIGSAILQLKDVTTVQISDENGNGKLLFKSNL